MVTRKKENTMKLFLDTAVLEDIKHWIETGIIDGITTNPTHLSKVTSDPKQRVSDICALFPHGDISVEVTESEPEAVYQQALKIAQLGKNITVKIPCHVNYYGVIKKLLAQKIRINITLVFTLSQALAMCKLGVTYISPFVGRWDDIEVDGIQLLHEIRAMIDDYGYETQVLAASLRSVRHFHDAITAGADVATLPVSILSASLNHILTEEGIKKFDADWKKSGLTQFP